MRCMRRNKRVFWYAKYSGKEELIQNGKRTGQFRPKYSDPITAIASISTARGAAGDESFGISASYDRTITLDEPLPGLDESAVLWIDQEPADDGSVPWDYVVEKVAQSLNFATVAVRKVSVQ